MSPILGCLQPVMHGLKGLHRRTRHAAGMLCWVVAGCLAGQHALAAPATCETSTMVMQDSSGNAMPSSISFAPKAGVNIFSGKMVWTVTKCNSQQHTFTSNLTGTALTGNPGISFTAATPNVAGTCPLTAASSTEISGTKTGRGTFDCVMTFPFTIDTTNSMSGSNIRKTVIRSGLSFGTTATVKAGRGGGSLDVVSSTAYTLAPTNPCTSILPSPAVVNLGTYSVQIFNNPGYTLWQTFNVTLNGCYDLSSAQFTMAYVDPSKLNLITNTGTAQGVAVELYTAGNQQTVIANGLVFSPELVTVGSAKTFSLMARMKKVPGVVVQAGSVAASATLTLTYP